MLIPTPVLTGSGSMGMISARNLNGHPYFFKDRGKFISILGLLANFKKIFFADLNSYSLLSDK